MLPPWGRVSHLGILVAGLERGRDRCPAAHPLHAFCRSAGEELILGTVNPAKVYFGPCNVGVYLNGACHDGLARGIDNLCTGTDLVNDLSIFNGDIFLVAFDALDRVEYVPVFDDIF